MTVDEYVWGREIIVWGYDPSHKYTFKILEPKLGKAGCLSLQYHKEKSESWLVLRGSVWALFILGGKVCTRIMREGDVQNVPCGVIHRLMGLSNDAQVAEPSTPDRHAADKSVEKDVVRLHCVFGRSVVKARNAEEERLVSDAVRITLEAAADIERGADPKQYNTEAVLAHGALSLKEN